MPGTLQPQQPNGDAPQRRGVYLLTHPRSASNLFQTMMAKQPGYQNSGYKLFDAGFTTLVELDKGKLSEWSEEEQEKLYDSFRVAFGKLEDELDDCAKNVSFTSVLLFFQRIEKEEKKERKRERELNQSQRLWGSEILWDGAAAAAATTVPHVVAILPCDGVLGSAHLWI
jgi:hypothetical protein